MIFQYICRFPARTEVDWRMTCTYLTAHLRLLSQKASAKIYCDLKTSTTLASITVSPINIQHLPHQQPQQKQPFRTMKFIASVIFALAATANTASAFTPARKWIMIGMEKGFVDRCCTDRVKILHVVCVPPFGWSITNTVFLSFLSYEWWTRTIIYIYIYLYQDSVFVLHSHRSWN